jgi:hypothetical protein
MRSELFPTRVRATAGGWLTNIAIMGSISGFAVGAVSIDTLGLSTTVAMLGVGVLISVGLVLMLPETMGMDLVRKKPPRTSTTRPAPPAG